MPSSKFKVLLTRKFCCTYELQYTHCFFWAKTDVTNFWEAFIALAVGLFY